MLPTHKHTEQSKRPAELKNGVEGQPFSYYGHGSQQETMDTGRRESLHPKWRISRISRWIEATGSVLQSLYRTVVMKRELNQNPKPLIYRSICVPTLTSGHKCWAVTKRTRLASLYKQAKSAKRTSQTYHTQTKTCSLELVLRVYTSGVWLFSICQNDLSSQTTGSLNVMAIFTQPWHTMCLALSDLTLEWDLESHQHEPNLGQAQMDGLLYRHARLWLCCINDPKCATMWIYDCANFGSYQRWNWCEPNWTEVDLNWTMEINMNWIDGMESAATNRFYWINLWFSPPSNHRNFWLSGKPMFFWLFLLEC